MSEDARRNPTTPLAQRTSRRRFLELSAAAGGAAVMSSALTSSASRAATGGGSHAADALVLTCMDFRLTNETTFFLNEHGLVNKYDQVILAGATLGVATDKFPAWAETFWAHLDLAVKLHGVRRVIAIDHRDCGAFKLAFDKDYAKNPAEETEIHKKVMLDFRKAVKAKHPSLEVELLLMFLDGHVQVIE